MVKLVCNRRKSWPRVKGWGELFLYPKCALQRESHPLSGVKHAEVEHSNDIILNSNNRFLRLFSSPDACIYLHHCCIKWHFSALTFQHHTYSQREGFIYKIFYCTFVLPCVVDRHYFQGFLFVCLLSFLFNGHFNGLGNPSRALILDWK